MLLVLGVAIIAAPFSISKTLITMIEWGVDEVDEQTLFPLGDGNINVLGVSDAINNETYSKSVELSNALNQGYIDNTQLDLSSNQYFNLASFDITSSNWIQIYNLICEIYTNPMITKLDTQYLMSGVLGTWYVEQGLRGYTTGANVNFYNNKNYIGAVSMPESSFGKVRFDVGIFQCNMARFGTEAEYVYISKYENPDIPDTLRLATHTSTDWSCVRFCKESRQNSSSYSILGNTKVQELVDKFNAGNTQPCNWGLDENVGPNYFFADIIATHIVTQSAFINTGSIYPEKLKRIELIGSYYGLDDTQILQLKNLCAYHLHNGMPRSVNIPECNSDGSLTQEAIDECWVFALYLNLVSDGKLNTYDSGIAYTSWDTYADKIFNGDLGRQYATNSNIGVFVDTTGKEYKSYHVYGLAVYSVGQQVLKQLEYNIATWHTDAGISDLVASGAIEGANGTVSDEQVLWNGKTIEELCGDKSVYSSMMSTVHNYIGNTNSDFATWTSSTKWGVPFFYQGTRLGTEPFAYNQYGQITLVTNGCHIYMSAYIISALTHKVVTPAETFCAFIELGGVTNLDYSGGGGLFYNGAAYPAFNAVGIEWECLSPLSGYNTMTDSDMKRLGLTTNGGKYSWEYHWDIIDEVLEKGGIIGVNVKGDTVFTRNGHYFVIREKGPTPGSYLIYTSSNLTQSGQIWYRKDFADEILQNAAFFVAMQKK